MGSSQQRAIVAAMLGVALVGAASPSRAELVRVEIASRVTVLNGRTFGRVGAYEKLWGRAHLRHRPCSVPGMEPTKSDQLAPHTDERAKTTRQDGKATSQPSMSKDANRPAAKPQGTLHDQVKTMESEGQAQPQADEVPPEERPRRGIPPLPEPDVEGVGEESGPAAAKTDEKGEKLSPAPRR